MFSFGYFVIFFVWEIFIFCIIILIAIRTNLRNFFSLPYSPGKFMQSYWMFCNNLFDINKYLYFQIFLIDRYLFFFALPIFSFSFLQMTECSLILVANNCRSYFLIFHWIITVFFRKSNLLIIVFKGKGIILLSHTWIGLSIIAYIL